MKAKLLLKDGTVYEGTALGARGEAIGEVVFNTSMTGYQEIMTDPSYKGQIVTMTYPLIGNYGVNALDVESTSPKVEGFIVREMSAIASNFRSTMSLEDFLIQHNVPGLQGIDTRALTKRIRTAGAMMGVLSSVDLDNDSLRKKLDVFPPLVGRDLVKDVTPAEPYTWTEGLKGDFVVHAFPNRGKRYKVVVIDYGIKRNILRLLVEVGIDPYVVPASTSAEDILSRKPDGIFLSNGPGDPEPVTYAIDTVRALIGAKPIFGICLGILFIGLALGGKTYKLKFGHRGANHPVKNLATGRVEITSQNHGFAVDPDTLDPNEVEITHINLNDQTLEGFRMKNKPVFCVQYHPEASPGPHDSYYLFQQFFDLMDGHGR